MLDGADVRELRRPVIRARRNLTASAFVGAVGQGLYLTCGVLFAVRWIGLTAVEVGLAMSVATGASLVLAVPVGKLVDRAGGRRVSTGFAAMGAAALLGYALATSYPLFLAASIALSSSIVGLGIAQNALVGALLDGGDRTRFKARQRSVRNIGMALGTLVAAIPLQLDVENGYRAALVAAAAAMAAVAWLAVRLRVTHRRPSAAAIGPLGALRDVPYMAVALLCGAVTMRFSILTVALPLWITEHTAAPHSLPSVVLLTNTVVVVLCQVRVAAWASTTAAAKRCNMTGCLALAGSCAIFATSSATGPIGAVTLVLTGVLVFTAGEMLTSAAAWTLAFEFTRDERHGEYQAGFALGGALGTMPGPVFAVAVIAIGNAGWALGASVFIAAGAATAAAVTWTARTRQQGGLGWPGS